MPRCHRCQSSYEGPPPYCEPCEEFKRMVTEEEHQVVCQHCGKTFMPGSFDRHRFSAYYRTGDFPRGARRREE